MASNQSITLAAAITLGLTFVSSAWADATSDACTALAEARNALYSLVLAKERPAQDALKAKMEMASAKLDSVLTGMTGAQAKAAADFKVVWDQFKATRDKEIVPDVYNGKADEAKKLADGIQFQRLSTMWRIMSCK